MAAAQSGAPEQAPALAPSAALDVATVDAVPDVAGSPLLVDALAATDVERRADTVHALQRRAGNVAVTRWLADGGAASAHLQRKPIVAGVRIGIDPDLTVEDVVAQNDPGLIDNLAPVKLTRATTEQKYRLIGMLAYQGWVGSEDEGLILQLWSGMGDLTKAAGGDLALWKTCVAEVSALRDLQGVVDVRHAFELDVKMTARAHLRANRVYVQQEMERFGIPESGAAANPMTDEQQQAARELQGLAQEIAHLMELRIGLEQVNVGYDIPPEYSPGILSPGTDPEEQASEVEKRKGKGSLIPATFVAGRPPHRPPSGQESPRFATYADTLAMDERINAVVAGFASRYPAMYALMQAGKVSDITPPDRSPDDIRRVLTTVLQSVLTRIDETMPKTTNGDLDWRDLKPIHSQVLGASVPTQRPWKEPFNAWVAEDVLEDHDFKEFWLGLGVQTLAAAAFLVAELATAGGATFFAAAAVGTVVSAGQAAHAWEHWQDLNAAAGASMSKETDLVAQGQASAEMVKAIGMSVEAFLGIFSAAGKAAKGSGAAMSVTEKVFLAARSEMKVKLAEFQQRIRLALRQQRSIEIAEDAKRAIDGVVNEAAEFAKVIDSGGAAAYRELNAEQRKNLADELMREVVRAAGDARKTAEAGAPMVAEPVYAPGFDKSRPVPGGGGGPPVRRPPSTHGGEGWDR